MTKHLSKFGFLFLFYCHSIYAQNRTDFVALTKQAEGREMPEAIEPFIQSEFQYLYLPALELSRRMAADYENYEIHFDDFLEAIESRKTREAEFFEGLFEKSYYLNFETASGDQLTFGFHIIFKTLDDFLDSKNLNHYGFYIQSKAPAFFTIVSQEFNDQGINLSSLVEQFSRRNDSKLWFAEWKQNPSPASMYYESDPKLLPWSEIYKEAPTMNDRPKVKVAVFDSGVDYNHPALAKHIPRSITASGELMIAGYDFMDDDALAMDLSRDPVPYHGTPVAGVIAQQNPSWLEIVPYRVNSLENISAAFEDAFQQGVRVINISLNIDEENTTPEWIAEMIEVIENNPQALVVVAAGNRGVSLDDTPSYPAMINLPNLITIGSSNLEGNRSVFGEGQFSGGSNFSEEIVDFFAPGEDRTASAPGGLFASELTGTSFAAPEFARYAAHIFHHQPEWSAANVVAELKKFITPSPGLAGFGQNPGLLDEARFFANYPL